MRCSWSNISTPFHFDNLYLNRTTCVNATQVGRESIVTSTSTNARAPHVKMGARARTVWTDITAPALTDIRGSTAKIRNLVSVYLFYYLNGYYFTWDDAYSGVKWFKWFCLTIKHFIYLKTGFSLLFYWYFQYAILGLSVV